MQAAHRRVLAAGYASTTLAAVAREAGVSVDTAYAVFGSKRGLLVAVMDVNVGGDDEPLDVLDRELPQRMRAESDQRDMRPWRPSSGGSAPGDSCARSGRCGGGR